MLRSATLILVAAISTSLLACGGGGSSSGGSVVVPPTPSPPSGGIEGTGLAIGPIDGFGSIFVNGIEFFTNNAEFLIDDAPGQETQLQVGQIVTVVGTVSDDGLTGTADQVFYDDNIEGPVDSIDVAAGQIVVLGQIVNITIQTTFGDVPGGSLNGLSEGNEVRVSGFVGADGAISATRIDLDTPDGEFEVRGRVSNLDLASLSFMINALVVDYSAAMLEGFSGGQPQDGDLVEVEGTLQISRLVANRVEFEDDLPEIDEGDEVELEGLITRFVSATDFDVAGFTVTTVAGTTFENGLASQLALDVLIEVEGEINAAEILVADKIEFGDDGSVRLDGIVEAVDSAASQFTVFQIPVTVTSNTRIEDKSDADFRPFSLGDLNVGDYIEMNGLLDPSGNVIATRVEREDAETGVSLRGPVSDVTEPEITIVGVTLSTSAQTSFSGTTATEFFANASGRIVEAEGTWDGARINVQTIGFED